MPAARPAALFGWGNKDDEKEQEKEEQFRCGCCRVKQAQWLLPQSAAGPKQLQQVSSVLSFDVAGISSRNRCGSMHLATLVPTVCLRACHATYAAGSSRRCCSGGAPTRGRRR